MNSVLRRNEPNASMSRLRDICTPNSDFIMTFYYVVHPLGQYLLCFILKLPYVDKVNT